MQLTEHRVYFCLQIYSDKVPAWGAESHQVNGMAAEAESGASRFNGTYDMGKTN